MAGIQMTYHQATAFVFAALATQCKNPNQITPEQRKALAGFQLMDQLCRHHLPVNELSKMRELNLYSMWHELPDDYKPETPVSFEKPTLIRADFIDNGPTEAELNASAPEIRRFYEYVRKYGWFDEEWQFLLRQLGVESENPEQIPLKNFQQIYNALKNIEYQRAIFEGLAFKKIAAGR